MVLPGVIFKERAEGVVAPNPTIKNRIGIVGQFDRGPINTATYSLGDTYFSDTFGLDNSSGSLTYRVAREQGATEFAVVRVLGNAQAAKGSILFNGIANKANQFNLFLKFVGSVVTLKGKEIFSTVNNIYTGFQTGRYYLYVDRIEGTNAYLKYTLADLETEKNSIDWSTITEEIVIDTNTANTTVSLPNNLELFYGDATQIAVEDLFYFRVNADSFIIPINIGDTPRLIANNFVNYLSGADPIGTVIATTNNDGVILELNEQVPGQTGNRYAYYLSLEDTEDAGITFTPQTPNFTDNFGTYFTGGVDGPRTAFRDYYDFEGNQLLRIAAQSVGDWGNNLSISINPLRNGEFEVSVKDLQQNKFAVNLVEERFLVKFDNLSDDGELTDFSQSKFIQGYFLPAVTNREFDASYKRSVPMRVAPIDFDITDIDDPSHKDHFDFEYLQNLTLENGYEGPPITEQDYLNGISQFSGFPVHIVLTDGYSTNLVNNRLVSLAENSAAEEGYKIALIATPKFLTPQNSRVFVESLTASRRRVAVVGWITYAGSTTAPRYSVPATAIYAGKLQNIPHYTSPAAKAIVGPAFGVAELDIRKYSSREALEIYTLNGLEVLSFNAQNLSYYFTNGITGSSDFNWQQIYTVRTFDVLKADLKQILTQFISRPHTVLLRSQAASACDAYLNSKLAAGEIANFEPTTIDTTNNSLNSYVARKMNVTIRVQPLQAADYIEVTLIQDNSLGLSLVA